MSDCLFSSGSSYVTIDTFLPDIRTSSNHTSSVLSATSPLPPYTPPAVAVTSSPSTLTVLRGYSAETVSGHWAFHPVPLAMILSLKTRQCDYGPANWELRRVQSSCMRLVGGITHFWLGATEVCGLRVRTTSDRCGGLDSHFEPQLFSPAHLILVRTLRLLRSDLLQTCNRRGT